MANRREIINSLYPQTVTNMNTKEVQEALMKLSENFEFDKFHKERIQKLFENDKSLLDNLNHLVIAASLMLSDASEMKSGPMKAYEMGDQIIIEEKGEDGWAVRRTLGKEAAQLLAHARAESRRKEIEKNFPELKRSYEEDPLDFITPEDIADPPQDPNPNPLTNPGRHYWVDNTPDRKDYNIKLKDMSITMDEEILEEDALRDALEDVEKDSLKRLESTQVGDYQT